MEAVMDKALVLVVVLEALLIVVFTHYKIVHKMLHKLTPIYNHIKLFTCGEERYNMKKLLLNFFSPLDTIIFNLMVKSGFIKPVLGGLISGYGARKAAKRMAAGIQRS